MTPSTESIQTELPEVVRRYLAAHAERDVDTALAAFGPDAVIVDDGRTYRGVTGVLDFLQRAGADFMYTTTLTGWEREGERGWIVRNRLEGDFPGGVADLTYRFTLDADLITVLEIGAV